MNNKGNDFMNHMTLPLNGLSCMGCARKVEHSLKDAFKTEILQLSPTHIELNVNASFEDVAKNIESVGFSVAEQTFQLSGLHCGGCVNKLTKHLEESKQIRNLHVETEQMTLETSLSADEIAQLVEYVGFTSEYHDPSSDKDNVEVHDTKKSVDSEDSLNKNSESNFLTTEMTTTHLLIKGMTCASCVSSVEKALRKTPNIHHVQVNLAEQSAIVFSFLPIEDNELKKSVAEAGYSAEVINNPEQQQKKQQQQLQQQLKEHKINAALGLIVGLPIMLWGVLGGSMTVSNVENQIGWGLISLICLLLLSTAGKQFYLNAWKSLTHARATMDTLVALGTGVAWLYSTLIILFPDWFPPQARHVYFEASAMIIGLISLGHAIESNAKAKTTQSLQALITLQPKNAIVINQEKEQNIPIERIQLGMHIRIKSGEQVPVDGKILSGTSYIDESMLTGEPFPVEKREHDTVTAGTMNQDGSLIIEATGVGADTMLAKIITMVRTAQSSKPSIAKLADTIASVFVPTVIGIAIISALIWFFVGPDPRASYMLVVATTVLIIACPCALGLATPLSVTVGIGKAADMGILIQDAEVLQKASKINTVIFDKTGTLTAGKPEVQTFKVLSGEHDELLSIAYALEQPSSHPLAHAICRYADQKNIDPATIENYKNLRGKGISAHYDQKPILIASINYLENEGVDLHTIQNDIFTIEKNAQTPVALVIDGTLCAIFSISDTIRSSAKDTIFQLNQMGINTVMLTGDNHMVAQSIANTLGIKTVISQVLPDEKAEQIATLQRQGHVVAMIGDGINDAPALAQSDISIAMGEGSDVAIESAQIALLTPSLHLVIQAIKLSRATLKNIKQNLFGAFLYNTLGIPIAAGILFPFTGFLLNPVVAGAAMALSSITVVSNANRLRFFDPNK